MHCIYYTRGKDTYRFLIAIQYSNGVLVSWSTIAMIKCKFSDDSVTLTIQTETLF